MVTEKMYGAILGDIIGSPYEFDRGDKTKDFPLFCEKSRFTDDTVITVAVVDALIRAREEGLEENEESVKRLLVRSLKRWGKKYPFCGYGNRFLIWLAVPEKLSRPYYSFGNGSAMRVSAAGWMYDTLEKTRTIAGWTAEITHNHSEGIKGAESVAAAIFLARNGSTKEQIRQYISGEFGYNLSRTCDEIRPHYHHVESCQKTVPEAVTAFLEGQDFEDVIRTAVSLGGDCDTLTCIAGSIAEAYYGVPDALVKECEKRLPEDIVCAIRTFEAYRINNTENRKDSNYDQKE